MDQVREWGGIKGVSGEYREGVSSYPEELLGGLAGSGVQGDTWHEHALMPNTVYSVPSILSGDWSQEPGAPDLGVIGEHEWGGQKKKPSLLQGSPIPRSSQTEQEGNRAKQSRFCICRK